MGKSDVEEKVACLIFYHHFRGIKKQTSPSQVLNIAVHKIHIQLQLKSINTAMCKLTTAKT